ncbi:MAG: response regulator transcription factor [Candidatus Eremiobacteraeota bacterium]|nr:response regulator transcription factor [Candidatus Eremiobacteraeota bacterium]
MPPVRIAIAEDDAAIRELLVHHFQREGFRCDEAIDGAAALRCARGCVDALILDLGLPAIDGLDVLRTLRREGRDLPVIVLSARGDEIDRVVGLEIGADDYVAKPFSPREIVARVKAVTRRCGRASAAPLVLRYSGIDIDEAAREAHAGGERLALKPREFALLLELARNPGVALSRSALLERVWGFDFDGDERTVDVHIRRIRARLDERGAPGALLQTVHGFGYKFAPR